MIDKIVLKGVASFKEKEEILTDKKVNLFYGLNGTGKSTLSEYLRQQASPIFSQCKIEGLKNTDTVLVYNQKFVQETFYQAKGIQGIFTLSKENAEAKKELDTARASIEQLNTQREKLEQEKAEYEQEHDRICNKCKDKAWEIKKQCLANDNVLEFCLEGCKNSKESLFNNLLKIEKAANTIDYTIDELKKDAGELKGETQEKEYLSKLTINVGDIEQSELLSKTIIGNDSSPVAALIKELNNPDWVNEGMKYIHLNGHEESLCPFCQQKTITQNFVKHIHDYFDEGYKQDITQIKQMITRYDKEINRVYNYLDNIKAHEYLKSHKEMLNGLASSLISELQQNLFKLREKERNPSIHITLQSYSETITDINYYIDEANGKIDSYNKSIANKEAAKADIKNRFWRLMREKYNDIIVQYKDGEKFYSQKTKPIVNILSKLDADEQHLNEQALRAQKKTRNIDAAIVNINRGLAEIGITDFSIEKCPEEQGLYQLKRENSDKDVFTTLSEGEKMIISFLYFVELCKGEPDAKKLMGQKIVVIDDPISSLSQMYIFSIATLIRSEFLKGAKYDQLFILTHSLYFFYELISGNRKSQACSKFFRVFKDEKGSHFKDMKEREIQNDYQEYWQIIRDESQAPALIANCMRNAIEYFFGFVEKKCLQDVFKKEELQETCFRDLKRFINRESHSDSINICDIKEFDYKRYKNIFQQVFINTGYRDHYNMMIKQ
jgi:hypothetical protein